MVQRALFQEEETREAHGEKGAQSIYMTKGGQCGRSMGMRKRPEQGGAGEKGRGEF